MPEGADVTIEILDYQQPYVNLNDEELEFSFSIKELLNDDTSKKKLLPPCPNPNKNIPLNNFIEMMSV